MFSNTRHLEMVAAPDCQWERDTAVPAARPLFSRSLHVLVVDDEPAICALFLEFLHSDRHTGEVADDSTALSTFRKENFDLVITDQTMTHMAGTELAAEMKKLKPDVPVVLLTGLADDWGPLDPFGDIDLVLGKPISRGAFRDALAQFASS